MLSREDKLKCGMKVKVIPEHAIKERHDKPPKNEQDEKFIRMIERLRNEANAYAITQKRKNKGNKHYRRKVEETNGIPLGGEALRLLKLKYKLEGKESSIPVEIIERERFNPERKTYYSAKTYTIEDLKQKFNKIPSNESDPEILMEILRMREKGL